MFGLKRKKFVYCVCRVTHRDDGELSFSVLNSYLDEKRAVEEMEQLIHSDPKNEYFVNTSKLFT